MEISNKPKLFIVDDDAVYLKALEIQFLEKGINYFDDFN